MLLMKNIKKLWINRLDGIGVVEIILILVVLIGLVLIFREQLTQIITDIFDTITGRVGEI